MNCLPVRPMVTTRMTEAVPMTMPSAVRAKRSLARPEAVDGQLENLAQQHGAAGAEQRLLEGEMAGLFGGRVHGFLPTRCANVGAGLLEGWAQSAVSATLCAAHCQ